MPRLTGLKAMSNGQAPAAEGVAQKITFIARVRKLWLNDLNEHVLVEHVPSRNLLFGKD